MSVTSSWVWKCPITIDHTKVVEDIPNATIQFLAANFPANLFTYAKSDGSDIRFTSDEAGVNEVAFEIVQYNQSPGFINVWVLYANLSSSVDTTIYVWYGNPAASAYAVTDPYGRNIIWTTISAIHVHHFNEASGTLYNATGNATYDGTTTAITYQQPVGDGTYCILFTAASNSRVALGGNSYPASAARTIQGWVALNSYGGGNLGRVISNEVSGVGSGVKVVSSEGGHTNTFSRSNNNAYAADSALPTGGWYHIAVTKTDAAPSINNLYVSGVLSGTANQSVTDSGTGICSYGCRGDGATTRNFDGCMNEMRMTSVVQSANALLTSFNNESDPASFSSAGTPVNNVTNDHAVGRGIMRGVGVGIM